MSLFNSAFENFKEKFRKIHTQHSSKNFEKFIHNFKEKFRKIHTQTTQILPNKIIRS